MPPDHELAATTPTILQLLRQSPGESTLPLPNAGPPGVANLRFIVGGADAILGGARDDKAGGFARDAVELLKRSAAGELRVARPALDALSRESFIVSMVDDVLRLLRAAGIDRAAVRADAYWLIESARHPGAMKLGIALLGASGDASDESLVLLVGRHEEFTLYSVVALQQLLVDPVDAIWSLARATSGWGKIQAVRRLAPRVTSRPDVREWLLRDGCGNSVLDEYLAYICATAGELAVALEATEPDDALLDGALRITDALTSGGPVEDLYDYADAPEVVGRLLRHVVTRCDTLSRLASVARIESWLKQALAELADAEDEAGDGERLSANGWTADLVLDALSVTDEILGRQEWPSRVEQAFVPGDPDRSTAWYLSQRVGLDLWTAAWEQLQTRPDESLVYHWLLQADVVSASRARKVVEFAETRLPLDEIASGPSRERFESRRHLNAASHSLDRILFGMREIGSISDRILAAALRSPVIRNRGAALGVIEGWPEARQGALTRRALTALRHDEPDERIRARVRQIDQT